MAELQLRTVSIDLSALDNFSSEHNVTLTCAVSAAWAVTLQIYTYSEIARFTARSLPAESVQEFEVKVLPSSTFLQILEEQQCYSPKADSQPSTELQINGNQIIIATEAEMPSSRATNMAKTFEIALPSLCDDATRPIQEFDFCSEFDLDITRQWTRDVSPNLHKTIPQIVSQQAHLTPDATAIEAHDGTMTYAELEKATSSLAQYLIEKRVPPSSCILLYFRRSLWAYVSMLAVMKAGCCYAAVDAIYSVEHVVDTVRAAQIEVVMTDEEHSAGMASAYEVVIPVSQTLVSDLAEAIVPDMPVPDDTCFIIFTSGSSGKRKGIRQQHGTFCTSLLDFGQVLSIGPSTRILCSEDLSFMIANAEIFGALAFGAVACVPSDKALNVGYTAAINDMRATLFLNSPTSIALINPVDVPTLKTVCSLGEPLSKEVIAHWAPAVRLGNIYGMSECSIWVGFLDHIDSKTTTVPIGRVPTGAIYLVNPSNSQVLVPVGAVGNIVFEGPIAASYLDTHSDYQADFLDPTPEWLGVLHAESRPLGKIYRSGDLGRCNSDGTIEYLGRKNRTIKLDGNFVNVEDIEALARPCIGLNDLVAVEVVESVAEAPFFAVFLQSPGTSDQLDHCTIEDCTAPEVVRKLEAIRQRLQEVPSIRVVPKVMYSVASMPRTPTGKIDRRLLREKVRSRVE